LLHCGKGVAVRSSSMSQVTVFRPDSTRVAHPSELRRGWKPLLGAAVGIGLGLSPIPTFTIGVFAVQLQAAFGWSRASILSSSIAVTIALLVVGPFVGRLTDRIGARPIALASTAALGVTTASLSLTTSNIWMFYALFAAMSVLSLGTLPIVYARVINTWFDRQRGVALGIALSTTGISGMLLPIYAQTLIAQVGWRGAYVGLGLLPLLITLPCVYFLLPRDGGSAAPGASVTPVATDGLTVRQALHGYRFWVMGAVALAAGAGLGGALTNMVPLFLDRGFSPATASGIFGLYGLAVVVGRLGSGWLLDRFWAPAVGCVFLWAPAVGAVLLASGIATVPVLALGTILMGLASGAEFDLVAYLTSRYFGRRHFSALYALQYAGFGVGSGIAPGIFGLVRDRTGAYDPILYGVGALFAIGAMLLLTLGRYPRLAPLAT
jgi:MFS family permease